MNPRRVVLYLRLSASADESVSLARQESELRAHADREGWHVAHVVVDDGVSGTKARANAERALAMLRDDEADILLVWALDRFSRQGLGAVAQLVETLDARPGALFVALKDGLRSDMAMWRVIAVVLAEVARAEAEAVSARRRSEIAYRRALGRHTSGSAPFGYRAAPAPDGIGQTLVPDPEESATMRRLADEVLAGGSLTRIVRALNVNGVPTGRSAYRAAARRGDPTEGLDRGRWEVTTLKRLLSSDRALGRLTHDGRPLTDDDGLPAQFFEPILSLGEVERLRERLRPGQTAPRRRMARLLSGLAYCAHCDGKLRVSVRRDVPVYRCSDYGMNECPSPSAPAHALEAAVVDLFMDTAGDWPEYADVITDTTVTTAATLADLEAAIRETVAAMTADDADVVALTARLADLKDLRATARATPATVTSQRVRTGRTLAEAFEADEDVDWRRSVLRWGLDHVTLSKARPGNGPRFDAGRVGYVPVPSREEAPEYHGV